MHLETGTDAGPAERLAMKKTLLAALIAATALVPAAVAQDRGGRWGGGSRAEGARPSGDRGAWRNQSAPQRSEARPQRQWNGGERAQAAPQPAEARPQRQWSGSERPQAAPQRAEGRPQRQWNGGERRDWNRQAQGAGQPRPQLTPQQQNERFGQRQRGGTFYGNVPQQRPQQFRGDGNRDWNRDRGPDRRDWNDRGRGNDRNWDRNRSGWNDNRGGWNAGRGRWDNGWRNDRRYDWRGYRNLNRGAYRLPRYYAPRGWGYGYQRFGIGFTLNSLLYSSQYWINDPFYYRLPAVEGPYRWVRYYNDALLVDIYTGEVVDTIHDIFW